MHHILSGLVYAVLIPLVQVRLTSMEVEFTICCADILSQVWHWLAVSLEEMLVPQRKSPSHALLKELHFSGEMKHLERGPCTTRVPPPGETSEQKLWAMMETIVAWFPLWAFVQLPHTIEPQLHAQAWTEAPVNHFHCTLWVSVYYVNVAEMYTWNRGEYWSWQVHVFMVRVISHDVKWIC